MPTFASVLAVDEDGNPAESAEGKVYAPSDTGATTPLAVTDLNGTPFIDNKITASALGVLPAFRVAGYVTVDWVSGSYRIPIPALDQLPSGGSPGQILSKASSTDWDSQWVDPAAGGGGTPGDSLRVPAVLSATDRSQTILSLRSLFGGLPSTGDANLLEARNSVASGTPGLGQLVFYLNEEAFPRVQNALNSKTLIRIRNWGTNVNAFQVTDSGGSTVLFNIRADDGFVTAPNIGEPIRGVLAPGAQPAPGSAEGIYLRRTV